MKNYLVELKKIDNGMIAEINGSITYYEDLNALLEECIKCNKEGDLFKDSDGLSITISIVCRSSNVKSKTD